MSTYGYSYLATHPDEKKPPIPYQVGNILSAQSYSPPPAPNFYYTWAYGRIKDEIRDLHPLQLCLKIPPATGTLGYNTVRLRIVHQIKVQDLSNSQVVKVEPLELEGKGFPSLLAAGSSGVAAKLYDPMYYDFDEDLPDPFANCDAAYAHETMAYNHLRPLYETVIPHFYGSYTVDIPLPDDPAQSRPVRAILYEYIQGCTLEDMNPHDYSQTQRQAIMAAVLDAHSKLWQLDVAHVDLHPRNVIVVSINESKKADIRLIDFGEAVCGHRVKMGHVPTLEPESRTKIIERWLDEDLRDRMMNFRWLVDWPWNDWLLEEYARDNT